MNKENYNNYSNDKSEIETKVVTVGSNRGHRALMIIILLLLVGGIYYLYFNTSPDKRDAEVLGKEEEDQNVQELKGKFEQVPDNTMIHERIITDLPYLPPLPTPQIIPEIKQTKKEGIEDGKEEKQKEISTVSNAPILPKKNYNSNITNNLPTTTSSFPPIGGGYPRDRRGAQMLVISSTNNKEEEKTADKNILSNTLAQLSIATKIGKLGFVITQGKIIDAVLETAINSDLQGTLRAVISSNVHAENGDTVLIPKGSRLIGSYSFDSNVTRARININWNRIILPHGIDIAILSPSTDELGRAGVAGMVDNKITSALFSSILLTGVSIETSIIGQKASKLIDNILSPLDAVKDITATEIDISSIKDIISNKELSKKNAKDDKWILGLGAIRKIKNASNEHNLVQIFRQAIKDLDLASIDNNKVDEITLEDIKQLLSKRGSKYLYEEAISKSINDFSKDIRDIVNRSTEKRPTVYIDQGTALKVFLNQDILFPSKAILN